MRRSGVGGAGKGGGRKADGLQAHPVTVRTKHVAAHFRRSNPDVARELSHRLLPWARARAMADG